MSRTSRPSVLDKQILGPRRAAASRASAVGQGASLSAGSSKGEQVNLGFRNNDSDAYFLLGLFGSVVAHAVVAYFLIVLAPPVPLDFHEQIFSVTIEGGKTLGGISQVPDENHKAQAAVPRNVSEKQPEVPESIESPTSKDVPEEVAVPDKSAEVSLAETKPTPRPTSAPTAKATAPPVKATAVPVKAVPVKATPKPKAPTKAELDKEYQASMQKYRGESTSAGGKGFGAAKVGGSGMGGGALRPPEFFRYRDLLEAFVKGGWRWFDPQAKIRASVVFSIAPDGTVSAVRIDQSSGNREFDESVLRAVFKANPVPKPPPSVYEQYFTSVRMIFEPQ